MRSLSFLAIALIAVCGSNSALANPPNKSAFARYFGKFLAGNLNSCTTCHLKEKGPGLPGSLDEYPHNPFGQRLARLGTELKAANKGFDISLRLMAIAKEDADSDGVSNLDELLTGHNPGSNRDKPNAAERNSLPQLRADFRAYLAEYRWAPFDPITKPSVASPSKSWIARNPQFPLKTPIDRLLATEYEKRRLVPQSSADKTTLLRRVTIDLVGLNPTPTEIQSFLADQSPNAYDKVVDRLLADPRYGERWARHWMDVWRYSDWAGWTDGGQIRDSQPHIWRWRDWIVESLNSDKGYDRMVTEMLAADEVAPEDAGALRATGFLVRNYKMLSREQWMEDTINHTSKALLGLTLHCTKCHNHMTDPFMQTDYYRFRAIFEPHQVRIDRIPGQPDTTKDGVPRAFDSDLKAATYLYPRGDERNPDKSQVMTAAVPAVLGGRYETQPIKLTAAAYRPDRREFVISEARAAADKSVTDAEGVLRQSKFAQGSPERKRQELALLSAHESRLALSSILEAEALEDQGDKASDTWKAVAIKATGHQRTAAQAQAEIGVITASEELASAKANRSSAKPDLDKPSLQKLDNAVTASEKKLKDAEGAFEKAKAEATKPPSTEFKPRIATNYPAESSGRRTALAKWMVDRQNPLVARVAVNHLWARHFGEGLVPSLEDFGRNGRTPSNPRLLDWLAVELMDRGWSMKQIHRMIVTSSAYRLSSLPSKSNAKVDPDNTNLWRMNSRRLEAEAVRDNVLWSSGRLDLKQGGPEIDHMQGMTTLRRSLYLREAAEKYVEFLQIFDGPNVTECYERKTTVMPQQALALANSELAIREARALARQLSPKFTPDAAFVQAAYERALARKPTSAELKECLAFLSSETKRFAGTKIDSATLASASEDLAKPSGSLELRSRENLCLALFNHTEFVTVR